MDTLRYYCQALSLWVANFFAQHEAPYLHTVTLLFLVALLVGVCGLSRDPSKAFVVEPFMIMQVAYNTMFMGLFDQSPPELLRWELHVKKRLLVDFVWICLHGYDNWFWWSGLFQFKRANAEHGNNVFVAHFGQVDLYQFIKYPLRVFNAYMITVLWLDFCLVAAYTKQQARSDHLMPSDRLKGLTDTWYRELDRSAFRESGSTRSGIEQQDGRRPIQNSTSMTEPSHPTGSTRPFSQISSPVPGVEYGKSFEVKPREEGSETDGTPPPYRTPSRTNTGLLKRGLLRFPSSKGPDLSFPPPTYLAYEPTFGSLNTATKLLASSSIPTPKPPCWKRLRKPRAYLVSMFRMILGFLTNPFRPSVLFAILSHAHNMGRHRTASYPLLLSLALRDPSYRTLDSRDIVLASRMWLTSNPTLPMTRWRRLALGWSTFGACSVLCIGTELTIQWNEIRGVQLVLSKFTFVVRVLISFFSSRKLDTVGQLIPFCVGAGGLLRVIWAAIMERDRRSEERWCYFGRCNAGDRRAIWKEASEQFQRCQDLHERKNTMVAGKSKAEV
ncbi:hypothetical protein EJ08DRAFT_426252 [Tothia fuscella]|uniref:Uncharacterized protein n=1 Tax=Tothia fuscella TaxID=1048955 RepID=A0A9P4U377_9PEZI|nr:hypothetical protein EJ08DRAFT_426252 [Tothia fuscella]